MKNLINRSGSKRVSMYFRNASASYDKRKRIEKAERQNQNNIKGEKKAC